MKTAYRITALLILFEGLAALVGLLRVPSEAGGLAGYSASRLAAALVLLAGVAAAAWLFWLGVRWSAKAEPLFTRLDALLLPPGRLFWLSAGLVFLALLCGLLYLFTYLVYPPHLRGAIAWAGLAAIEMLGLLAWRYRAAFRRGDFWQPLSALPRWSNLDGAQRRVFWLLALAGLLYLAAFAIPNATGAGSLGELSHTTGDEAVTYPIAAQMLRPSSTPAQAIYRWFIYEDYHYGYPFYVASALALLPARVLYGAGFADHLQLNLLLLRELVSVLPVILAALALTYLQTRFRSLPRALGLFGLLLTIPQIVSYNLRFWHPDGLVTLMAALTLFFLDQDAGPDGRRFCLGLNYSLAAVTSGLAAGIKLWGFFFFLAVGGYLLFGAWRRRLSLAGSLALVLRKGALFIGVMALTLLLSNPFLLVPQARARMVTIMTGLNQTVSTNLPGSDQPGAADFYRLGLEPTLHFLEIKYGSRWFLLFLAGSLLAAAIWGPRKVTPWLMLAWLLPMGVYFTFFLPYKSYHYWMPVMLPLYSGALGFVQAVAHQQSVEHRQETWMQRRVPRLLARGLVFLVVLVIVAQMAGNVISAAPEWRLWVL